MSIWQFNMAVKGYIKANTQKEKGQFKDEEEIDEMFNWLISKGQTYDKLLKNKVYLWDGIKFEILKEVEFVVKVKG